jgi:hypothetical protein
MRAMASAWPVSGFHPMFRAECATDQSSWFQDTREVEMDRLKAKPFITAADPFFFAPTKPRDAPGVATLDFDNDGDADIYVWTADEQKSLLSVSVPVAARANVGRAHL